MSTRFEPTDVVLRTGRTVRLRAIGPADEEELLQAFDRLGAHARYMRFMHSVREANIPRLRKALDSFPEKGLAIAATVPAQDGIDIVGSATFMIGPRASASRSSATRTTFPSASAASPSTAAPDQEATTWPSTST